MPLIHTSIRTLFLALALSLAGPFDTAVAAEKLPAFDLPRLDGSGNLKLAQVLGKGPVLINFWAAWCKPCLMEAPELVKLYDRYGAAGFEIVAISIDQNRPELVKEAVKRTGMDYTVLTDSKGVFAKKMAVRSIPTSVLIDSKGEVVRIFQGYFPGMDRQIAQAVEKLLPKEATGS